VEVLGELLIEVDEHGTLLPLHEVVGDGQRALEPHSVGGLVVEEDPPAPVVLLLLGVGVCDLHGVPEVQPEAW
jgi:hypothetical protein